MNNICAIPKLKSHHFVPVTTLLRLSRGKGVTLRLWQICKMMEAARNNARTQTANESDLLYKVKRIHITPYRESVHLLPGVSIHSVT